MRHRRTPLFGPGSHLETEVATQLHASSFVALPAWADEASTPGRVLEGEHPGGMEAVARMTRRYLDHAEKSGTPITSSEAKHRARESALRWDDRNR